MKNLKHLAAALLLGAGVSASAQCENLNGDFEDFAGSIVTSPNASAINWINNDLTNWFVSHGSPTTGASPSTNMWMWSYNGRGEGVFTNHTFTAGQTYTLTYDLWRDGTSSPDSEFRVELSNSMVVRTTENNSYPTVAGNLSLTTQPWTGTGSWVTITETFTPAANYSQLWMHPYLAGLPDPWQAAARIDNVCIVELATDPCGFEPRFDVDYKEECVVTFINSTSIPAGLTVLSTTWDFGDGSTATGDVVKHFYNDGTGFYEVCMTIWAINEDGECCQLTTCMEIDAPECSPCEFIERGEIKVTGTNPFTFEIIGLPTGMGDILGYHWNFGDGTTGTGSPISHTYTKGGGYEVCVTIYYYDEKSRECCSATICTSVEVKDVPKGMVPNNDFEEGKAPIGSSESQKVGAASQVLVSPNPSNGKFRVEMRDGTIIDNVTVINQAGQVVYQTVTSNISGNVSLDLSNLDKGTYFIILNDGDETTREFSKLIIQ